MKKVIIAAVLIGFMGSSAAYANTDRTTMCERLGKIAHEAWRARQQFIPKQQFIDLLPRYYNRLYETAVHFAYDLPHDNAQAAHDYLYVDCISGKNFPQVF